MRYTHLDLTALDESFAVLKVRRRRATQIWGPASASLGHFAGFVRSQSARLEPDTCAGHF